MDIRIAELEDIIGVRHRVLRPGRPRDTAHFADDTIAGTFHLGLFPVGSVVAAGSVSLHPNPSPHHPSAVPWQLRGMAVDVSARGRGYGLALVERAKQELQDRGAHLLWCNSRLRAQSLYERAGMVPFGERFEIEFIGPHQYLAMQFHPNHPS